MSQITHPQPMPDPHPRGASSRWLQKFLPHPPAANPVFRYETRRLPDILELERKTIRWVAWPAVIMLLFWIVWVVLMLMDSSAATVMYLGFGNVLGVVLLLSLCDKLLLDFAGVVSVINSVKEDAEQGRWDVLCITDVQASTFVAARHAIGQIRAWRTLTFVIGIRLMVVVISFLHFFIAPVLLSAQLSLFDLWQGLEFNLETVIAFASILIITAIYVIEPLWRLRALTAASVAIATRRRDTVIALISGLGAILGVWAAQVGMAIASMLLLTYTGLFGLTSEFIALIFSVAYLVGVGGLIYGIYAGLTSMWLERARRGMVKLGMNGSEHKPKPKSKIY